jgi:hypothetical protein
MSKKQTQRGTIMKISLASIFLPTLLILLIPCSTLGDENDRTTRQAHLDAECEAAREQKLAPAREKYVEECVRDKPRSGREYCERFYSDYGAQSGNRAPLYYNLPECVSAFEFRKSYRQ